MVTSKEIAARNIAPERTIYQIIKERAVKSTAVKKASGHPRVSSKHKDYLLLRSRLMKSSHHQSIACSILAAEGCECICTHSEVKTFRHRPCVKKGSKEATSLQEKHQGRTQILQEV